MATSLASAAATLAGQGAVLAQPASQYPAGQKTPPRQVPWLKDVQQGPRQAIEDGPPPPPLLPLLVDAGKKPIRTREQWETHRVYLLQQWQEMVGELRTRETLVRKAQRPPSFEIRESERLAGISRRRIRYQAERGVDVEAYLLMPDKVDKPLPGVVVMHSTVDYTIRQPAGLEGVPEAAWGLNLAKRGMVVICPRCFLWNDGDVVDYKARVVEHQRRHSQSRGIAKMLYDAQRAIDLLCSLPEVDPQRIGAAGHSLGAKETLYLTALDERVKAGVFSEGGIGTTFSNWEAPWYWGSAEFFGREHHELLALIAPRPFLLIGGDSADGARSWPFVEAALGVYKLYGEPARLGLYNHRQGHTIPPFAERRAYEWMSTYL